MADYTTEIPPWYTRVYLYTAQFPENFQKSFASVPLKDYIRLIWIVGAYILLRPYIEKGFQKWMAPDLDRLRSEAQEAKDRDEAREEGEIDPETGLPKRMLVNKQTAKAGDIRGTNTSKTSSSTTTTTNNQASSSSSLSAKPSSSSTSKSKSKPFPSSSTSSSTTTSTDLKTTQQQQQWGSSARARNTAIQQAWERDQQQRERELLEEDEEEAEIDNAANTAEHDEEDEDMDPALLKGWDY